MLRFFDNNISNKNIVKPGFFPIENDTDTKQLYVYTEYTLPLWEQPNKESNLGFGMKNEVK